VSLLLSLIDRKLDNFIVDHCLCTLFELSQMEGSKEKIIAEGGIARLAELLKSENEPTKYYVSNTLGHLVADLESQSDIELLITQVVPLLQNYLVRKWIFSNNPWADSCAAGLGQHCQATSGRRNRSKYLRE